MPPCLVTCLPHIWTSDPWKEKHGARHTEEALQSDDGWRCRQPHTAATASTSSQRVRAEAPHAGHATARPWLGRQPGPLLRARPRRWLPKEGADGQSQCSRRCFAASEWKRQAGKALHFRHAHQQPCGVLGPCCWMTTRYFYGGAVIQLFIGRI